LFGFGKGKIEIQLDKYNFKPGETIKGKLVLKLKKPVNAKQLRVAFVGEMSRTQSRIGIGAANNPVYSRRSEKEYIYKFEMPLDGEKEYTGGEYSFEILIPSNILDQGKLPDGTIGTALKAVQFLSGVSSRVNWYVKASLDVPKGLDVKGKAQINIG
jgi:hypothetical protein